MSKREQYGLIFDKVYSKDFGWRYFVVAPDTHSMLRYIGRLCKEETESFIEDLNQSFSLGRNYEDGFYSDSVEDIFISYEYPNVTIYDSLIISMEDMRDLLKEWLAFLIQNVDNERKHIYGIRRCFRKIWYRYFVRL